MAVGGLHTVVHLTTSHVCKDEKQTREVHTHTYVGTYEWMKDEVSEPALMSELRSLYVLYYVPNPLTIMLYVINGGAELHVYDLCVSSLKW